jgi:methylenetetrahydrofolate dehydrogenase (NADP+)/methenyltetrahydrofolate cyclohydrolase
VTAQLIDGKAIAERTRAGVKALADEIRARHGIAPGLHVVLVGEDPASKVYVGSKEKMAAKAGFNSVVHRLPATTSESELLALIDRLNRDEAVDGILVQLPLPRPLNADRVIDAIDPDKDVDGFHLINVGRLSAGRAALVPCTPQGSMILIRSVLPSLAGKHAVVIGRSAIVGKPMAQLLLNADCTVTIAHSKTADLPGLCRTADILVAAVGRPHFVRGDWVKPGAVVIDVGINRLEDGRLVGDVDTEAAMASAGAITPVPGGVGPMTIACLLQNTAMAALYRRGLPLPAVIA